MCSPPYRLADLTHAVPPPFSHGWPTVSLMRTARSFLLPPYKPYYSFFSMMDLFLHIGFPPFFLLFFYGLESWGGFLFCVGFRVGWLARWGTGWVPGWIIGSLAGCGVLVDWLAG